jgi:hypothetical protein
MYNSPLAMSNENTMVVHVYNLQDKTEQIRHLYFKSVAHYKEARDHIQKISDIFKSADGTFTTADLNTIIWNSSLIYEVSENPIRSKLSCTHFRTDGYYKIIHRAINEIRAKVGLNVL